MTLTNNIFTEVHSTRYINTNKFCNKLPTALKFSRVQLKYLRFSFQLYTAKNVTDVLKVVNFTGLSISPRCSESVKMLLAATRHLQTCYNLLKQLAANLWITSSDNQLGTSLLTTCNRLVVNKLPSKTAEQR